MSPGPQPSTSVDDRLLQMLEERPPGREYTQREIARYCGVHHSRIGQIERGALEKLRYRAKTLELGLECFGRPRAQIGVTITRWA